MADNTPAWLAAALGGEGNVAGLAIAGLGSEETFGRGGFTLRSAAFTDGGPLDPCFTAQEEDAVAPPLEWSAPPPGSEEIVLVVEDPDAPGDQPFCHWLVWGLAGQKGQLLEGEVPPRVGKNGFGNSEWALPDPPAGDGAHRYVFQLFALDLPLVLMPGATKADLLAELEGHVVATALLVGRYEHQEDEFDLDDEAGE